MTDEQRFALHEALNFHAAEVRGVHAQAGDGEREADEALLDRIRAILAGSPEEPSVAPAWAQEAAAEAIRARRERLRAPEMPPNAVLVGRKTLTHQ